MLGGPRSCEKLSPSAIKASSVQFLRKACSAPATPQTNATRSASNLIDSKGPPLLTSGG